MTAAQKEYATMQAERRQSGNNLDTVLGRLQVAVQLVRLYGDKAEFTAYRWARDEGDRRYEAVARLIKEAGR